MVRRKKSKLYDHCDVKTSIDTEKNIINVFVNFKKHMLSEKNRVRYSAYDVLEAVNSNGIPAVEIVEGLTTVLNNRTTLYLSGEYVFSLVEKQALPQKKETSKNKLTKPTKTKTKTVAKS